MGIDLKSAHGSWGVNWWTWRPIHDLVAEAQILPEELWELAAYNVDVELNAEQVELLAGFLEDRVLPRMQVGQRMRADRTITDEPDDGTLHRDDLSLNYSIDRAALVKIIEFLRAATGPVVIG